MSGTYTAQVLLKFVANGSATSALSGLTDAVSQTYTHSFGNGTGANQLSQLYQAQITIAASSTLDVDLAGSLSNVFGTSIIATKIKTLLIVAASGNTNNVLMGGGNTTVSTIFNALTDKIKIRPGGMFYIDAPDATGYAITAGSADIITFANSSSGTGVTFDLYVGLVD